MLLTALLTGLLIPYINARLSHRQQVDDLFFEADLARQQRVLDAEAEFLASVEDTFIDQHFRMMAVAWYRSVAPDSGAYQTAWEVYDDSSWAFHRQMAAHRLKAGRLLSPGTLAVFDSSYAVYVEMDSRLVRAVEGDRPAASWDTLYRSLQTVDGPMERAVGAISDEFGLSTLGDRADRDPRTAER